jgi:hypothetical protein
MPRAHLPNASCKRVKGCVAEPHHFNAALDLAPGRQNYVAPAQALALTGLPELCSANFNVFTFYFYAAPALNQSREMMGLLTGFPHLQPCSATLVKGHLNLEMSNKHTTSLVFFTPN